MNISKINLQSINRMIEENPQYCQGNADDFINAFAEDKKLPWASTPPVWLESEMFKSLCLNEIEMNS